MGWTAVQAQPVLVPPVQYGDRVATVEQASTDRIGSVAAPPLQAPAAGPETFPLQWGPVRFHPHLGYQIVYGDGVLVGTNNPATTVLHTVSPGAFLELGKFWNFDFTASFNRYSNAEFNNNQSYYAALRGHIPREKWLLDFGYLGSVTDQPQVGTAQQTRQSAHLATASATYNYQTRLSLELSAAVDARLAQSFNDYWTLSTLEWLNYQATTKTTLGLGVGGGYNLVDPGLDWTFEQVQGRVVWLPGAKLSVQLSAGVQFQQFSGDTNGFVLPPLNKRGPIRENAGESRQEIFPLFGTSLAYQPFEQTALSLSASHSVGNSYLSDLFVETTTLTGGFRQRLFGQFSLQVQPGYTFTEYQSTRSGHAGTRDDDFFTIYAGVSTVLFKKLNVAVFYQFTDVSSTAENFAFDSTQIGLRLDYRY